MAAKTQFYDEASPIEKIQTAFAHATKVIVAGDRSVTFQLPSDVEPGEVQLTVVVHPQRKPSKPDGEFDFPTLHLKEWPKE